MHLFHLAFLHLLLTFLPVESIVENSPVSSTADEQSITSNDPANSVAATSGVRNLIYQSTDGGTTWQDISYTLPENAEPSFFAGDGGLFLRYNDKLYYSKSNLRTPVWEKQPDVDPEYTGNHPFNGSISFNPSGVTAYGWNVQVYQKMNPAGQAAWSPVYPGFKAVMSGIKRNWVGTVFESSGGTIFVGAGGGLFK